MVFYIVRTRKTSSASMPSEIEGYQVNGSKSDVGTYYSKSDFFRLHYKDDNNYYSWNPYSGNSASLYRNVSVNGEPFMQSVANSTGKDNLLELPNC